MFKREIEILTALRHVHSEQTTRALDVAIGALAALSPTTDENCSSLLMALCALAKRGTAEAWDEGVALLKAAKETP